jgi:hypothetical protein
MFPCSSSVLVLINLRSLALPWSLVVDSLTIQKTGVRLGFSKEFFAVLVDWCGEGG